MANPNQEIKFNKLFINNRFVDSKAGKTYPVINPANGKVLTNVVEANRDDVDLAVQAARLAFRDDAPWRIMDHSRRGKHLLRLVDLLKRDRNILANLETLDTGKPLEDALLNVKYAIDVLRYYAGYADKIHGKTIPVDGQDLITQTRRVPLGVVAQILSHDYPIDMLAWKAAPALAAGNVLIIKPSYKNPLTALYFAALTMEAGFPEGVVNVLTGHGDVVGQALALHEKIAHISLIGKTETGKLVMESAAKSNLKKVSLHLSGNSPLVIDKDFDLRLAVEIAHRATFENQGQSPSQSGRIYVHEDIHDEFVKKSIELARQRVIGNPFEANVRHGPLVDEKMLLRVMNIIEAGKKEGAKLEYGGKRIGNAGFYLEPTILSNVRDEMRIAKEQIYGPVQVILKYKSLDEVIVRANKSKYGMAAGILTLNIDHALMFAKRMKHGTTWINTWDAITPQTPFGGFRQSGNDKDLGYAALNSYLQTKTVAMRLVVSQMQRLK